MQEYVQKSTSTTLPRSCASVSGRLLIQSAMPTISGAAPYVFNGTLLRPFGELADPRDEQREREEAEQRGADLDLVLLTDAEQAPEPRAGEQERREGCDEA